LCLLRFAAVQGCVTMAVTADVHHTEAGVQGSNEQN